MVIIAMIVEAKQLDVERHRNNCLYLTIVIIRIVRWVVGAMDAVANDKAAARYSVEEHG